MKTLAEHFRSAHRKGLKRLTPSEFLAVMGWQEALKYGDTDGYQKLLQNPEGVERWIDGVYYKTPPQKSGR